LENIIFVEIEYRYTRLPPCSNDKKCSQPFRNPWWWSFPSSWIWFLSAIRREVRAVSATIEIIMRVVARTHRLIQLNDSFAGPKHHLRVCPGSICIFASMAYVCLCVRVVLVEEERESEKDERTFQPIPRRVVASRNNTMLLMLRLQFRHNFLSRSLESGVGNRVAIGCPGFCSVTAKNVISADRSDNEERRISFTVPASRLDSRGES